MNPEGFAADVLGEPAALARVLERYGGDRSPLRALGPDALEGRRVVLLGMGSSRFAALTAATALRARGVAAWAEWSSSGAPAPPSRETVAVAVSASGTTPETVEALERHAGTSRTVAVTNDPGSPLAAGADVVLALEAGTETGGVACRTFQATLAVLLLLAGAPAGALRPAVAAQEALFAARDEWLPPLLALLEGAHTTYALAPAERISSALQSALVLREGPRVPADAAETGDWLHVDVYLTKRPGYRALLFPGSRFDPAVMEWARDRGSSFVAVGPEVAGAALRVPLPGTEDPRVSTLVETSVTELLAAAWWRRRAEAGTMP